MRHLEIIHLRSSGEPIESLSDRIGESVRAADEETEVISLYRREGLETDVAIHIYPLEGHDTEYPSALGLRLASALRAFGLVEHTTWEKLR